MILKSNLKRSTLVIEIATYGSGDLRKKFPAIFEQRAYSPNKDRNIREVSTALIGSDAIYPAVVSGEHS
jgi:hypothetical protein